MRADVQLERKILLFENLQVQHLSLHFQRVTLIYPLSAISGEKILTKCCIVHRDSQERTKCRSVISGCVNRPSCSCCDGEELQSDRLICGKALILHFLVRWSRLWLSITFSHLLFQKKINSVLALHIYHFLDFNTLFKLKSFPQYYIYMATWRVSIHV